MSPSANYVEVLPGNPILVRALERELRVAEREIATVLSYNIRRLAEGLGEDALVGQGPHLARVAAAREMLREAETNYQLIVAELERAHVAEIPLTITTRTEDTGVAGSGTYVVTLNDSQALPKAPSVWTNPPRKAAVKKPSRSSRRSGK